MSAAAVMHPYKNDSMSSENGNDMLEGLEICTTQFTTSFDRDLHNITYPTETYFDRGICKRRIVITEDQEVPLSIKNKRVKADHLCDSIVPISKSKSPVFSSPTPSICDTGVADVAPNHFNFSKSRLKRSGKITISDGKSPLITSSLHIPNKTKVISDNYTNLKASNVNMLKNVIGNTQELFWKLTNTENDLDIARLLLFQFPKADILVSNEGISNLQSTIPMLPTSLSTDSLICYWSVNILKALNNSESIEDASKKLQLCLYAFEKQIMKNKGKYVKEEYKQQNEAERKFDQVLKERELFARIIKNQREKIEILQKQCKEYNAEISNLKDEIKLREEKISQIMDTAALYIYRSNYPYSEQHSCSLSEFCYKRFPPDVY